MSVARHADTNVGRDSLGRSKESSLSIAVAFLWIGRIAAMRTCSCEAIFVLRRDRFVALLLVLLLRHSFFGPLAMSCILRPVQAERGLFSRLSFWLPERSALSCCLIRSQLSCFSPGRRRIRTRCQPPLSFLPSSVNAKWPLARPLYGSFSGCQRPRSQISTVPP